MSIIDFMLLVCIDVLIVGIVDWCGKIFVDLCQMIFDV